MEAKKIALNVAGVIFLLMSIFHLVRFIFKLEVVIGDFTVPVWYSLLGFIIPFLLSLWIFKSVRG